MDYNVVWLVSINVCYESFVSNFWFRFCLTRSKKLRERERGETERERDGNISHINSYTDVQYMICTCMVCHYQKLTILK